MACMGRRNWRGSSMIFGGIRRALRHMAIDESNDLRFWADRQFQRRFAVGNVAVEGLPSAIVVERYADGVAEFVGGERNLGGYFAVRRSRP